MENCPSSPGLNIGRMSLRVPGSDAVAGERIARQTGDLLAAGAAGAAGLASRHLGAIRLRVQAPPGASEADLARAVSRALLQRLTVSTDA